MKRQATVVLGLLLAGGCQGQPDPVVRVIASPTPPPAASPTPKPVPRPSPTGTAAPSPTPPVTGPTFAPTPTVTVTMPAPSAVPSPEPRVTPGPVESAQPTLGLSDSGIEVVGGSLEAVLTRDGQPLTNAMVKLYGPTLGAMFTNSAGKAKLGPLVPGAEYRVVFEATGLATVEAGSIMVRPNEITTLTLPMKPGLFVTGRVLAAGEPVAGATVSDGLNATLTDGDGVYRLEGVLPGDVNLSVAKSRFTTATRTLAVTGPAIADFTLAPTPPIAYFDDSVGAGVAATRLAGLRAALVAQGWQLDARPPEAGGVWALVCPGAALAPARVKQLQSFVAGGGKLVVFGEWGGFGSFPNPAINGLVHGMGAHFNPDLVRDPASTADPDRLALTVSPENPAIRGVSVLTFYRSSSLFALSPYQPLVRTAAHTYRVQDNATPGSQTVVASGPYRGGKIILVGDSSAFTDDDTDGNGIANLREPGNQRLVERLFDW